jgi:hypothetical protein
LTLAPIVDALASFVREMKAKRGGGVMAEMDDVLAELRHRIIGQLKPAQPQHQETPATSVNIEQRQGSAAVALRRLAHPGRDRAIVAEDHSVSEPINPERGRGVVVEDDPISPLLRRLSLEMPELMGEVVAFIERRTAELNDDDAAPGPAESVVPAALVRATPTLQDDDTGIATITLRFDTQMLARIDADAKRLGISRTAWLHVAAGDLLEAGDDPVVGKRDAGRRRLSLSMPAMADATMPVAIISRIIPPIMNELLIFTPHFAPVPGANMGANG